MGFQSMITDMPAQGFQCATAFETCQSIGFHAAADAHNGLGFFRDSLWYPVQTLISAGDLAYQRGNLARCDSVVPEVSRRNCRDVV